MEKRKRTHEIHLRLNDKEYAALERNRKRCRLPQQTYLRFMCENVIPREAPQMEAFDCLKELGRIGNNLNQLAYTAHRSGYVNAADYEKNVEDLWETMNELFRCIVFPEDCNRDYVQELIQKHLS